MSSLGFRSKPPKLSSSKIIYQESYTILASCFFYHKVTFFSDACIEKNAYLPNNIKN